VSAERIAAVDELIAAARVIVNASANGPANKIISAIDRQKIDWAPEVNAILAACDRLDAALIRFDRSTP
jgi:hypothetical protein